MSPAHQILIARASGCIIKSVGEFVFRDAGTETPHGWTTRRWEKALSDLEKAGAFCRVGPDFGIVRVG